MVEKQFLKVTISTAKLVSQLLAQVFQISLFAYRCQGIQDKSRKSKNLSGLAKGSERSSFIPINGEEEILDGGWVFFGKFFVDILKSIAEIIGGLFSYITGGFRKKSPYKKGNLWPLRDSLIPDDDDDIEPQLTPRKKKTVTFREPEIDAPISPPSSSGLHNGDYGLAREYTSLFISNRSINQNHGYYQDEDNQDHVQPLRHHSSAPETYFERDYDTTNEVVFGDVQETIGIYKPVDFKPVDYGDPMYNHHNIKS